MTAQLQTHSLLNSISQSIAKNSPLSSLILLDVSKNPQFVASLKKELQNQRPEFIEDSLSLLAINPSISRGAFEQFISSYLKFVKSFDPFSVVDSIDLVLDYLNGLIVAFNASDELSEVLCDLLIHDLAYSYKLCELSDKILYRQGINRSAPIRSKLTVPIAKLYNNCKKSQTTNPIKKSLLLKCSNYLLRIFFIIGQPLNCNTIFISNKHRFTNLKGSDFSKCDLLVYRYYLGRYLMLTNRFKEALIQFKFCYQRYCVRNMDTVNFTKVLEAFIVILMVNGFKPSMALVSQFRDPKLSNLYGILIDLVGKGNITQLHQFIEQNADYLRSKALYNLFLRSLTIICYRNLFYRTFKIANKPSTITYTDFVKALSIIDAQVGKSGSEEAEEILVSLISHKWIKGVILSNSEKVLLSRKGSAFPPPGEEFHGESEFNWLDK